MTSDIEKLFFIDCARCRNGTNCQCVIMSRTGDCGCVGFQSCPDCGRTRYDFRPDITFVKAGSERFDVADDAHWL